MDTQHNDLLELVRFTEQVSLRLHGLGTEKEIFGAVQEAFSGLEGYAMVAMRLSEDSASLRMAASTMPFGKRSIAEKIMGNDMSEYPFALSRSPLLTRVVLGGETLKFHLLDLLGEMLPGSVVAGLKAVNLFDNRRIVATPLRMHNRPIGLFSMSSPRLIDEFVPSVRNLAQHISTVLELSAEQGRRAKAEQFEDLAIDILDLLNQATGKQDVIREILRVIQDFTGFDAVGIRLKEGDDYPYYETRGFDEDFARTENSLCVRAENGDQVCVVQGGGLFQCMCGNVIQGRTDPTKPYFTEAGGFWTNSIAKLLTSIEADPDQHPLRKRCADAGYESVALVPLRTGNQTIGLLQLNDRRTERLDEGMVHCLEGLGNSIGVAIVRREAEKALVEEQARVQQYLELAGVMFIGLDTEARITLVNRKACEILGHGEADLVGADWFDTCLPRGRREETRIRFCRIMRSEIEPVEFNEGSVVTSSGEERIIYWHNTAIFDRSGNITGMLSSGEDITERKRAEEERERLREQYHQAQKMEAIGALAGGVAHDLNNMFGAILGYADMIRMCNTNESDEPLDRDLDKRIGTVISATNRAANVVSQLLAFSQQGKYQDVPVDINLTVRHIVSLLKHSIDKRIRIEQSLASDAPVVCGEPSQIQNALLNISVNACDAMPSGGVLRFETQTSAIDSAVPAQVSPETRPGTFCVVAISDTGCGMDEETMKRIFEPFFTTKPTGKATGLGLASAYGTVQNHGGFIQVKSEPGRGASFNVYLPLAEAETKGPDDTDDIPCTLGARVLVVDDEAVVGEIARNMLEHSGYQPTMSASSSEALALFRSNHDRFDLVILDMMMPGQNGLDVFREMKRIDPNLRAILSTGYAIGVETQQALDEGMLVVIQKPYDSKKLVTAVEKALGARHPAAANVGMADERRGVSA